MKNNLQTTPLLFKMIVLVTCFMLAILYNKSHAATLPSHKGLKETGGHARMVLHATQPAVFKQPSTTYNN